MGLLHSSLKVFNYPYHLAAFRRHELLAPVHIRLKPFTERGRFGLIRDCSFKDFWFSHEARDAVSARQCPHPHHCVAHQKTTAIHEFHAIDPEHGKFV